MQISDRLSSIKPSLTLSVNSRALELKAQGVAVTSLAVGEPDFPPPPHVCEAAKAAIDAKFLPLYRRAQAFRISAKAPERNLTTVCRTRSAGMFVS